MSTGLYRPIVQEGLGLRTGDVVRTSYGTGPYEIWRIWGPYYWWDDGDARLISHEPVVSLRLIKAGTRPRNMDCDFLTINHIYRDRGGYRTIGGDALEIERADGPACTLQLSLFDAPAHPLGWDQPYPFRAGLDYGAAGPALPWMRARWTPGVWHCRDHGDFWWEPRDPLDRGPAVCPACGERRHPYPRRVFLVGPVAREVTDGHA
jgi:hypothetical protein